MMWFLSPDGDYSPDERLPGLIVLLCESFVVKRGVRHEVLSMRRMLINYSSRLRVP